jgi:flagellar export protein FliJ
MMQFHFTLGAVLRVAHIREESEWSKLQAIQKARTEVSANLQSVQQAQLQLRRDITMELSHATPASWLQAADVCMAVLKQRERTVQQQLQQVTKSFAEQHRTYTAARQKSQVLDKLRATRLDSFRREVARREQIGLDDVFLNRYR